MLASSADGGGVQVPGRRGLHAGLIPAPSSSAPHDETGAWGVRPSASKQGTERSGRYVAAWEADDYCTLGHELPAASSTPRVPRGIRAVSIVDTLLSGHESSCRLSPPPSHRARGRTPDWIKRIFELAKRGNLEQLRVSLRDMDATLVRNLSDHHGNNLVHVLAAQGHAPALAWLCASLGAQLDGALGDENRSGLTPAACAVKYGHTNCLEWLVTNTRLRDSLRTRDGERCLLHTAAKYSQESVVRWLVQSMRARHLALDQRDHAGDTPLHLAARAGGLECCRLLLAAGADVSVKNESGLRAADVAIEPAVRHYLALFEASLGVASELARSQAQLEALQSDTSELRGYFRDVLGVGKRLAKERDELCRDGRLRAQEQLAADLAEENRILRERLGLSPRATSPKTPRPSGERLVGGLADMEHRLLLAEEGWRRLQHKPCVPSSPAQERRPLDILMKHLEVTDQRRSSCLQDERIRSLSSSESSLDTLLQQDNIYSQLLDPSPAPTNSSREEVRKRLREMSLTSESGNASVLEVIEPTSEDEKTGDEYSSVRELEPPDLLMGTLQDGDDQVPLPKKRTFLQKLSLKASWPSSKRNKLKTGGRAMSADDFKETYLRNSPCTSSGEEAASSGSTKSSTTVEASPATPCVLEHEAPPEPTPVTPPPPPPPSQVESSPPNTELSSENLEQVKPMQQHHIESMSVTTSEDSGCIVARPCSAASKSDSLLSSRPDSSTSSFKLFPLRLAEGRVSPAPSDASKPSSLLGKIEEVRLSEDQATAEITNTQIKTEKKLSGSKHRAWYDLSDEEPDLLSSTALVGRNSSDEEACNI